MDMCQAIGNLISLSLSYFIYKMGIKKKTKELESSLVIQWLELHAPNAGDYGSIHML